MASFSLACRTASRPGGECSRMHIHIPLTTQRRRQATRTSVLAVECVRDAWIRSRIRLLAHQDCDNSNRHPLTSTHSSHCALAACRRPRLASTPAACWTPSSTCTPCTSCTGECCLVLLVICDRCASGFGAAEVTSARGCWCVIRLTTPRSSYTQHRTSTSPSPSLLSFLDFSPTAAI